MNESCLLDYIRLLWLRVTRQEPEGEREVHFHLFQPEEAGWEEEDAA